MQENKMVVIEAIGSVSALGCNKVDILESLETPYCHFQNISVKQKNYPVIPIHKNARLELKEMLQLHPSFKKTDRAVQLALLATEKSLSQVYQPQQYDWTINAGSSRGATGIWEANFAQFQEDKTVPIKSSPLTTLGNISSHVAQHFKLKGFHIDHSITCSSGLQALANGMAWLKSGLTKKFLAIGTEAPLTPFTIAQMAVLGIYSKEQDSFPCKPCSNAEQKTNTFVLGEGAVSISLAHKKPVKGDVVILGIGTASEQINNLTSISKNGTAFAESMKKAIKDAQLKPKDVDIIIPHSPGTYQGDQAEKTAIESVIGNVKIPVINHKFLTGHTLGASGLLSVELAYYILQHNMKISFPYPSLYPRLSNTGSQHILINAMGFGGNAVSIMLKKV